MVEAIIFLSTGMHNTEKLLREAILCIVSIEIYSIVYFSYSDWQVHKISSSSLEEASIILQGIFIEIFLINTVIGVLD